MNSFWNKGETEIIKGLDVLGLRSIDQHIETQLVSSITTISIRARYLSLIPWLAGEFFHIHEGKTNLDRDEMYHQLMQVFDRLELVIILSTQVEKQKDLSISDTGIIGQEVHEEWENEFYLHGMIDTVILKEKALKMGYINPTYGTYYNPSRGFGLLSHSSTAPVALPPHGQAIYNIRKSHIKRENGVLNWLLLGGLLTKAMIEEESEHFSIANIDSIAGEVELLQEAFLKPYSDDQVVVETYERFDNTLLWVLDHIEDPKKPQVLIKENFNHCTESILDKLNKTELMWFEYELRRRVHYALELLLKALSYTVDELNGATIERVVFEWMENIGMSDVYSDGYALYSGMVSSLGDRFDAEVFDKREPIDSAEQALHALSTLEVARHMSKHLMSAISNPEENLDYMRSAFKALDNHNDKSAYEALTEIIRFCVVEPHLKTTLRKMGQGQQCSLRFFPEGQKLIPTGNETYAGKSGSRLDNTVRMMADIGICDEIEPKVFKQNEMSSSVIARLREAV